MEEFYQILILSKNYKSNDYLVLSNQVQLIDQTTIFDGINKLSFDYLIFDDELLITNLTNTNILCDQNIPVVNFFGQTSIENIFYKKNIDEVLCDILCEQM